MPAAKGPQKKTANHMDMESVLEDNNNMDDDVLEGMVHVIHILELDLGCIHRDTRCYVMVEGQTLLPASQNSQDRNAQPTTPQGKQEAADIKEYVRVLVERLRPLPILLANIIEVIQADDCLQQAMVAPPSGRWDTDMATLPRKTAKAQNTLKLVCDVKEWSPSQRVDAYSKDPDSYQPA
ncbi:hypothetical protein NDU88_004120 [Pleurodeles waltl]|uniref:Uncharacterized protein n=1 Tax=Pleurodeles waltl TaxID=8319 RepID=A0AAV7NLT3_PLEWA|nr:hypothetical protein NDU88_004120 [Pleurodeles waltl]